ncbi:hypothetical protein ACOSP7_013363 [Xanthoceras sorbifolium]
MASSSNLDSRNPRLTMSSSAKQVHFASISKALNFNLSVKLNRDNFIHWKVQILPAIRALQLKDFINEGKLCPNRFVTIIHADSLVKETVVNEEFVEWERADQLLLCWLMTTVSEGLIREVTECHSSLEFWRVLESMFSRESLAKILQLKQQLQNAKKGSSTISEFVLKVRSYGNGLKSTGQVVTDQDLLLSVLNGLGHEYDPMVVILSQQQSYMSLHEAQYMLMTHEQRIEHLNVVNQIDTSTPSVNFAAASGGGRGNGTSRGGFPNGGRENGNYNNRGKRGKSRWNNSSKPTCQICSRVGHSAQQCYNRYDRVNPSPQHSQSSGGHPGSNFGGNYNAMQVHAFGGNGAPGQFNNQLFQGAARPGFPSTY